MIIEAGRRRNFLDETITFGGGRKKGRWKVRRTRLLFPYVFFFFFSFDISLFSIILLHLRFR